MIIALDFDDTLVCSEALKREVFSKYIDRNNFHTWLENPTRVRYFQILKQNCCLRHKDYLLEKMRVQRELFDVYRDLPIADSNLNALTEMCRSYRVYLVTAGNLESIKFHYGHHEFFRVLGGAVKTGFDKSETLIRLKSMSRDKVVMIGDSDNDARSADKAGCTFLRVNDCDISNVVALLDDICQQRSLY